jgi:hypothetical protein
MNQTLIKNIFEKIIKEIQSVITILYLFTVGIGMLFNYYKYTEFGINIFDYAGIFDFLIAPFADIKIVFFTFSTVIITVLIFYFDRFWETKYPKSYLRFSLNMNNHPWYKRTKMFFSLLIFIIYLFLSANLYGKKVKKEILNHTFIEIKFIDNEVSRGILIGKIGNVIFLYQDKHTKVIPVSSFVKEFTIE